MSSNGILRLVNKCTLIDVEMYNKDDDMQVIFELRHLYLYEIDISMVLAHLDLRCLH
jgi:hypothetical protein